MPSAWPYPKIIAHRGGGVLAPENTITAIEKGISYGFKAVEFDVMLSSDNIPMLMHDHILERTIRNNDINGKGLWFNDLNYGQLKDLDVGSWFNPELSFVRIPTLEEVIKCCSSSKIWMNIEIKPVPGREIPTGEVVADICNQYFSINCPDTNFPLFSSFSYDALLAAKSIAPQIPRGYLVDSLNDNPNWKEEMINLEAISVHTNYKNLTIEQINEIKSLGYYIMCYTVNNVEIGLELFNNGVDSFCTDRLDLFQKYL